MQNLFSSSLLPKNLKIKIYRNIILSVLYGCKTWLLTLTEERRLRGFENRVLRGIFGPKRDEVTREWRRLYIEELNDLYSSPNTVGDKIEKEEMGGHAARMGESRGVCIVLVGNPEGKIPPARARRRYENNIKMDIQEVGCGDMG